MLGSASYDEEARETPEKDRVRKVPDKNDSKNGETVDSRRGGRTYSGEGLRGGGGGGVAFFGVGLLGRGQVCTSGKGVTQICGSGGRRVREAWQGSG